MTTPSAAPRGSSAPDCSAGAALSDVEPGELMYRYDQALRALGRHSEPGDADFERWLALHGEVMTRLARDWGRR